MPLTPDHENPLARVRGDAPDSSPAGSMSAEERAQAGYCPRCGEPGTEAVSFTWWGGALGPRLFNHRVCRRCGFGFDGATGESNRGRIVAYLVVVNGIFLALLAAFYARR